MQVKCFLFLLPLSKKQMSEIQSIIEALITFRDKRNWKQFHNTKDLALALSIEAAELNELAEKHDFDIKQIILEKIRKNEKKYPVEKSRNSARKYNDLH